MAQVRWTPQSLEDLRSIFEFIARDAPSAANVWVMSVLASTHRLGPFPMSGRTVPEFGRSDLREVIVRSYRVKGDLVEVLTVHHGARELGEDDVSGRGSP